MSGRELPEWIRRAVERGPDAAATAAHIKARNAARMLAIKVLSDDAMIEGVQAGAIDADMLEAFKMAHDWAVHGLDSLQGAAQ